MDDVTTVIKLCRDYGLRSDTAYAMRARASAETTAAGPGGLVLLAWSVRPGDTRYAIARWK